MMEPVSTSVWVRSNGQVKLIKYARYLLNVLAVYQGQLTEADVNHLLGQASAPTVREALRGQKFGTGLTRGDQFYLSVAAQGGGECAGFIEDAPPAVRGLVQELLALEKRLSKAAPADAYVRSEPLPAQRLTAIRQAGQQRITFISDLPADLQPPLTQAINVPLDFIALDRAQYERLLAQFSSNRQFFIVAAGSGHQLTLFTAQSTTASPPLTRRLNDAHPRLLHRHTPTLLVHHNHAALNTDAAERS
jgi:hypothetical protein